MARVLTDAALAASVAEEAGDLLLQMRERMGFYDPYALGDAGDMRANTLILDRLHQERPHDAILSEEAVDDVSRVDADRVWIVDPVDGTREYGTYEPGGGRSDWAVHVALWSADDGLIAGAVALPALGVTYLDDGSAVEPVEGLASRPRTGVPRVVVSSSRPPAFADEVAAAMAGEVLHMGSAGAKAMAVVRGEADAYVHAGGQYEWDSAAPVAVARAAGLHTSRIDGSPLIYNQRDSKLPDLIVCRPELADAVLAVTARR